MSTVRGLPRIFIAGVDASEPFELPQAELDKLRKVLRLGTGAAIAVLPNDGSLVECRLEGRNAVPLQVHYPNTESPKQVIVAQSLPKGDKLDEIVRACTEIGVAGFTLFHSDRTVVRWEADKFSVRVARLEAIAREACEVSFRTKLPTFDVVASLDELIKFCPTATVLSESELALVRLTSGSQSVTLVVGPEGGWSPRELALIGDRGVTLGPRVLRVDHAAAAAAALLLL